MTGKIILLTAALSAAAANAPTMQLLGQTFTLADFNQKAAPMWEFTTAGESVDNWTRLLTVLERPDAKSREDLDRLAQGIMDAYKSRKGQVLMAKTLPDPKGIPYNYIIVAFDEPAKKRYELNYVKIALGAKSAYVVIYGARVANAKTFLNERSGEIGMALAAMAAPNTAALPRR
jgi:hypothetical protein